MLSIKVREIFDKLTIYLTVKRNLTYLYLCLLKLYVLSETVVLKKLSTGYDEGCESRNFSYQMNGSMFANGYKSTFS